MTHYSTEPRDQIFEWKDMHFLSFSKNIGKNIGINISKNVCGKYSLGMLAVHQKLLKNFFKSNW